MTRRSIMPGLLAGLLPALFATGCSDLQTDTQPRTAQSRWNRINLPGTSPDAAFDAAVEAVRQYFTTFDASRANGRIETSMVEYTQRGGTGRIRDDALKPSNRMRRQATLLVTSTGDGAAVLCEVRVQRLDTADQRAYQQHREFNDVPNQTPIERDAGVTGAQSESWTDMPRDSKLERDILESIHGRVMRSKPADSPSAG